MTSPLGTVERVTRPEPPPHRTVWPIRWVENASQGFGYYSASALDARNYRVASVVTYDRPGAGRRFHRAGLAGDVELLPGEYDTPAGARQAAEDALRARADDAGGG